MTKIGAESLPAMGSKINLTACPGPGLSSIYNGSYYYNAYAGTDNERAAEGTCRRRKQ